MKVLPTLHIQNGRVVSIPEDGTPEGAPLEIVSALADLGCTRLALVDVDAARGQGHNRDLLAQLIRRFRSSGARVCLQVGGGIRSSDQAQFFLDQGATWLVVGTILHRSPILVEQLLGRFRDQLTAAVDARWGQVQASGWMEDTNHGVEVSALRIRAQGFRRLLFIDIPQGPGAEPDFASAQNIAEASRLPVFMGGSLRTVEHVQRAAGIPGLSGVLLDARTAMARPALLGNLVAPCPQALP